MKRKLASVVGAALVIGAAGIAPADVVVDPGDVVDGHYRFQYSSRTDKYYQNGFEFLSGWASGASSYSNLSRYVEGLPRYYLKPASGPGNGLITWGFDFSQTGQIITGLQVQSSSHVFHDGGGASDFVRYYVSADGVNWVMYSQNTLGTTAGTYYDLSGYVAGGDKYYIKAEAYVDSGYTFDAQLFRQDAASPPTFDVLVALRFLDPTGSEVYASVGPFGIETADIFITTTTGHLRTLAMAGPSTGLTASLWQMGGGALPRSIFGNPNAAPEGEVLADFPVLTPVGGMAAHYDWEAWGQGYGEGGDIGGQNGLAGLGYSTGGVAFGVDRWLNLNSLIGVYGGWASSDLDLDSGLAGIDAETWRVGVQGLHRWNRAYLLGSFHYGAHQYDGQRILPLAGATANADFDADEYGAYVELGFPRLVQTPRLQGLEGVILQPLVAFQYVSLNQDGFTETGAGVDNLVVAEQGTDSSRLSVGLLVTKAIATGWGILSPYLEGRYTRELNDDAALIDAAFVNRGPGFLVPGVTYGNDFGEVRAGASLQVNERTTITGGFEGRYTDNSRSNGGFGMLRVRF